MDEFTNICSSCKGSGLWGKTYEDVPPLCEFCNGAGEDEEEG